MDFQSRFNPYCRLLIHGSRYLKEDSEPTIRALELRKGVYRSGINIILPFMDPKEEALHQTLIPKPWGTLDPPSAKAAHREL